MITFTYKDLFKKTTKILSLFCLFVATISHAQKTDTKRFLVELDSIRTALKIPGLSVAIKKDDTILLESGLGYADMAEHLKATPSTTYRIASISKTFASTLIMQLVEKGRLNLDTPISNFGIDFGNPNITVRHILTHTSEGKPGSYFQYNGYRFSFLQSVVEQITGKPYYQLLMEEIVGPSQLVSTAPGISLFNYFKYRQRHNEMNSFFETAFSNLATPYALDGQGKITQTNYLDEFGTSTGIVSNVSDLLKYSSAIDQNAFLNPQTQRQVFTANTTNSKSSTPYGLGWFVQNYNGVEFYWHYGQTQGESGLFVKVPSLRLTLVVLANAINLSAPFPLGDGDLFMSPIGQIFYKYFLNKNDASNLDFSSSGKAIKEKIVKDKKRDFRSFYNKELIVNATMYNFNSKYDRAAELYKIYSELNFPAERSEKRNQPVAQITEVGINQDREHIFSISDQKELTIIGVGENCSPDFKSWCDYGWIEDDKGNVVWTMQDRPATHAGGSLKNQKVTDTITLPAGAYKLRYKSDWAHAFNNWDSLPPDNFQWGIKILNVK